MQPTEEPRRDVMRRIEDVSSKQYLDMSSDAPSFDLPAQMDPDSQMAFLDVAERRLHFFDREGRDNTLHEPELKRLDQRRHGELCLVTSGQSDERGWRVYWLCRVER